jgi:glycosyltransferase involved in cell wall biosynthesis
VTENLPMVEMARQRVVFLLPALDLSGAERMALRIASGLDQRRFEPIVVGFIRGTGLLEPHLQQAGLPHLALATHKVPRAFLPLLFVKWCVKARPDVLLTFMYHANMVGRFARLVRAVPALVCSERIVGFHSPSRIRLNRLTARLADAITTNSRIGQRFWAEQLRLPLDSIRVVYNGVDLDEFSPRTVCGDVPKIGVLAQLQERNGHRWFIDVLERLHREHPSPWLCLVAGIGPEERKIRDWVRERGLQSRVNFVGHCADAPDFLRTLHVTVHPALASGMPNAVIESMAAGVPAIATSVGGTPEVIEHAVSGYLVEPGDVDTTVRYLRLLLTDHDRRRNVGLAARERIVKDFSVQAAVRETERIISQVTSKHIQRV